MQESVCNSETVCVCVLIDVLQVHLELGHPEAPVQREMEEKSTELFEKAAIIVSEMQTPHSTITALLKKLREKMSDLQKDIIRDKLKREISTALKAGGIPMERIDSLTMVFVSLLMRNIEVVYVETGESIILYLRCLYLESLWSLREMILSGLLLSLLSEAITHVVQSQPRVHLIVRAKDFNMCLSSFRTAAGRHASYLLELYYYKL